jgi:hypothetical protein
VKIWTEATQKNIISVHQISMGKKFARHLKVDIKEHQNAAATGRRWK